MADRLVGTVLAIDIGGTADVWAGIRTRRRMTPEAVEQYKIVNR